VPALKPLVYKAKTRFNNYSQKASSASFRKSKSYALGSRSRSQGPELELNGTAHLVDRSRSNIEKTVEWEVTDTERGSDNTNTHTTVKSQDSWLDDSDEVHSGRRDPGMHYGSTAEITRSSFGLKR
jgi:hypothetical protein